MPGLAICLALVRRRQRLQRQRLDVAAQPHPPLLHARAVLVDALQEGLFQLESDRLQGDIGGEEYTSAKCALEGTIRWAVRRAEDRKANTAAS
jgi:hypothetical protein